MGMDLLLQQCLEVREKANSMPCFPESNGTVSMTEWETIRRIVIGVTQIIGVQSALNSLKKMYSEC